MAFGGWYVLVCDLRWYDLVQSEASSDEEKNLFSAGEVSVTQVETCSQTNILDMTAVLSANAVNEVLAPNFDAAAGFQPTVQVFGINKLPGDKNRYKLMISDGRTQQTAMLSSQLSALVERGELVELAVVKLKSFTVNNLHGRPQDHDPHGSGGRRGRRRQQAGVDAV